MAGAKEEMIRGLLLFGPAAMLCLLGLFITLRSGVVSTGAPDRGFRRIAENASQVAVRLSIWAVAFAIVLEAVGARVLLRAW